jgi:hypothetical protein
MAVKRGTIGIVKKDPLSNGEVHVPFSIIVNESNSVDLISFDVVNKLGIADEIKASDITSLEEVAPGIKGSVKGTVKIKFHFLEDAQGISPVYVKHYWRTLYVPEETDCSFDVSLCRPTATILGWDIPKHLNTEEGHKVVSAVPNPGKQCSWMSSPAAKLTPNTWQARLLDVLYHILYTVQLLLLTLPELPPFVALEDEKKKEKIFF